MGVLWILELVLLPVGLSCADLVVVIGVCRYCSDYG